MLKLRQIVFVVQSAFQPPSGGCVLKHDIKFEETLSNPAAFGRLCVETTMPNTLPLIVLPAAFGRLCVETVPLLSDQNKPTPAAFGRLCVETDACCYVERVRKTSRLRAAVC